MVNRFELEKYKGRTSRHTCPVCKKKDVFVRYVDTATELPIANSVGRCNRESKCGHHFTPKDYYEQHPTKTSNSWQYVQKKPPRVPTSYIAKAHMQASLTNYDRNCFIQFLHSVFDTSIVDRLVRDYQIGSSKLWRGATVFWQTDNKGNVRTGKIMLYDPNTGKRVKKPNNRISWVHSVLKLPAFHLQQCLFGEHLVAEGQQKEVMVVESEKTAIVAAGFMPEYVWVATGGLSNLSAKKCTSLAGRKVTLFPDLGAFEKWSDKAAGLHYVDTLSVSELLETEATPTDRESGLDLADFLLQEKDKTQTSSDPQEDMFRAELTEHMAPDWNGRIRLLDCFFGALGRVTTDLYGSDGKLIVKPNDIIRYKMPVLRANRKRRGYYELLLQMEHLAELIKQQHHAHQSNIA